MKVAVLCFTGWFVGIRTAIKKGLGVWMASGEEDKEGRGGNGGDDEKMETL